jgi:hypothetical protein
MAIVLDGTAGITTPDVTDTSLTATRVVYAGTSGNLTGSASLIFDGTNLGVLAGSVTSPAVKLHAVGTVRSSNSAGTIHSNLASDGVYSSGTDLYLFAPTGYANIFYANNVERMRLPVAGGLKTSTTISVGNATPAASGAGITFPASVDASSDANTLDDYEEGTWTPTYSFSTSGSVTYSSQRGYYRKVGSLVFVECNIIISGVSSPTGNVNVNNLPFIVSNQPEAVGSMAIGLVRNLVNAKPNIKAYSDGNSTTIVFAVNDTISGSSELQGSDLKAGTLIYFSGCYITN